MNHSRPGLPVHHQLPKFTQTHVHWVDDAIQPSHPLLSPSPPALSVFPSIRILSNESALHNRWPKYWSFSLNISPSNEHPGQIVNILAFWNQSVTTIQLCSCNKTACMRAQSCPTLCDTMNCSTPGLPVHHQLLESTQTHVHWVGDAIQPSHPLSSLSPSAFNLSQHQGLFQWVSSLHQVAKVLEFQLQHQSLRWTLRTDLF